MYDDRHADPHSIVEKRGNVHRQVHAAVRAAALVDLAAEGASPTGVMESLAAVEGHPVIDPALITASVTVVPLQITVPLLGVNAKTADSRRSSAAGTSRHAG